jgi:hypothetical protein
MKIKNAPKKRKRRIYNNEEYEIERGYMRLPQLNKYFRNRALHGFGV